MNTFAEQLKKYRSKRNRMTREELAKKLSDLLGYEVKITNVTSWERGTNPKIEVIEAIAEVLNIPVQYLFDDSDDAIKKIVNDKVPYYKEMADHTEKIPLLKGYAGAGSGGVLEKSSDEVIYIDKSFIDRRYQNRDIKALVVIGDSMIPFVDHGDIVLFSEIEKGRYNLPDGKYVITTINGTMVKNLKFKLNGDIVISSCNQKYDDEIIKANESQEFLDIIGFVVGRVLKS